MQNRLFRKLALAAGVTCVLATAPAMAQDMSANITCVNGNVADGDYSELDQYMRESAFDRSAGVSLVGQYGGLRLKVTDPTGRSVCEDEANNWTACRFRISSLVEYDTFTIRIDNPAGNGAVSYRLCAY